MLKLFGNLHDGLIQAQPGLHANHQQVEGVGEPTSKLLLPPPGSHVDILVRPEESHTSGGKDDEELIIGRRFHPQQRQTEHQG